MTNTYKVETVTTAQEIADLLVGAFKGGSNHWCHNLRVTKPVQTPRGEIWYASGAFYEGDFEFTLDEHDDNGDYVITHTVTPEKLQAGLQIFANNYSTHYGDFIQQEEDAETSDAFLQCIILGEIVYYDY